MTQIGCDARAQPLLALIGGQGLVPSTNREFGEAFLSDQDRWPSGAGLPKETARGGADDTVDVDDHSDAGAVGVLLTLGLDDRAVDLVVELVGNPSPTFDRLVTRSGTIHLKEHERDPGALASSDELRDVCAAADGD